MMSSILVAAGQVAGRWNERGIALAGTIYVTGLLLSFNISFQLSFLSLFSTD